MWVHPLRKAQGSDIGGVRERPAQLLSDFRFRSGHGCPAKVVERTLLLLLNHGCTFSFL